MGERTTILRPEHDDVRDRDGFRARRARVGRRAGARRLGLSIWEVDPGQAAYPYHFHLSEEELVVVLEGRAALRTPEGWSELAEGDAVSFPRGERGAHQVVNAGAGPLRFLAFSTSGEPEIIVQPDSGKVGAFERRADAGGLWSWFRQADEVGYLDGERPPELP